MHKVIVKGILSNKNGVNLYRGCTHGCIYCDSRSKCYHIEHEFTDIEVKSNAIELLDKVLKSKRKKIMIGTGSMCDPYLHLEGTLLMTRQMLEVINKYQHGVTLLTKSDMILRDMDILKQIKQHSKVIISTTLTTSNETLCKMIEPNVATTFKRVEMLKKFSEEGFITGVWLTPILPFINDDEENFQKLLSYCLESKVKYIMCFNIGVTLREGDREYFYEQLDKYFPGIKEKYIKMYGTAYEIVSPNNQKLYKLFIDFCKKNDILYKPNEIFAYLGKYESNIIMPKQLSLFDI